AVKTASAATFSLLLLFCYNTIITAVRSKCNAADDVDAAIIGNSFFVGKWRQRVDFFVECWYLYISGRLVGAVFGVGRKMP
ncbi:MAG: hypothetical protein IJE29_04730, partial [Firmicutes bacterium]|nr:hypothetical protein [Bacillota bacterium]